MGSLSKQILAEIENVETALINLEKAVERDERSVVELAAIGTFIHNIYNGIESILKQTLIAKNIKMPKSNTWHRDLLNIAVSFEIISKDLSDKLYEYLTFRHFFIHAYGFMLDEAPLEELAENIPEIWSQFISEIEQHFSDANEKASMPLL